MKEELVQSWFGKLREAWLTKNISSVKDLLSEKFEYYENPLKAPFMTWTQVEEAWRTIDSQNIIELTIEPLVCKDLRGSARYHFKYKDVLGDLHESDGAYYVKLDREGRAVEFRQWWMSK